MIFQTYLTSARFFCGTCSDDFTGVFHFIIKTVSRGDESELIQNCGPTKMRTPRSHRDLPWDRWRCILTSNNFRRIKPIGTCHVGGHSSWKIIWYSEKSYVTKSEICWQNSPQFPKVLVSFTWSGVGTWCCLTKCAVFPKQGTPKRSAKVRKDKVLIIQCYSDNK